MINDLKVLAVIPARGGSKGIPRKNLRLLNGKPLIYYAIQNALKSKYITDVYVSSEDQEILHMARQFGAKIHRRDESIANDSTPLDPVIYAALKYAETVEKRKYDLIVTMQPTSPLLKVASLDKAIKKMIDHPQIDTIIAAKDDTHLSWKKENNVFIPNYEKRVNRQYLTPIFTETGAFLITRNTIIAPENRIGKNVDLYILRDGEEIDIDTYADWNLCKYYLRRKHILFVVTGNEKVGLGHVYNTLLIANDILNHRITFLVDKDSKLAYEKIASKNYPVYIQQHENIIEDIRSLKPDVVINDRLDTNESYIKELKKLGIGCINFEDLGEGAKHADLVINAIYPEKNVLPNHYFGHKYFILRDEFLHIPPEKDINAVKKVLITFGGVDPNNYTRKVLDAIYEYCRQKEIEITVIAGFGYNKYDTIASFEGINIEENVTNISDFMYEADIVFTSAGRTTYEIASIGTPAIVLAQNERELTHFFASSEYGFLNLGLGYNLTKEELLKKFKELAESKKSREYMNQLMRKWDLKSGRKCVLNLIQNFLETL